MIVHCFLTVNIQWFLCTVIKFQVVNEAIQSKSSLAFIASFNLFVIMPFQYCKDNTGTLSIQSGVRLIEFFNKSIEIQFILVFVSPLIYVSTE